MTCFVSCHAQTRSLRFLAKTSSLPFCKDKFAGVKSVGRPRLVWINSTIIRQWLCYWDRLQVVLRYNNCRYILHDLSRWIYRTDLEITQCERDISLSSDLTNIQRDIKKITNCCLGHGKSFVFPFRFVVLLQYISFLRKQLLVHPQIITFFEWYRGQKIWAAEY